MFVVIEINCLMWGVLWAELERPDADAPVSPKTLAICGFVLSAILQHWAYYGLYKHQADSKQSAK